MTRAPTTLHEHFRADPRGADSFGKWIEDRIWELLCRPGFYVCELRGTRVKYRLRRIGAGIRLAVEDARKGEFVCLTLINGTIIREWAADGEATTGHSSKTGAEVER